MGRGIADLDASLTRQLQRPDKIIFVIITAGQENASREFNCAKVLVLIKARKAQDWEFVFFSAHFADRARLPPLSK